MSEPPVRLPGEDELAPGATLEPVGVTLSDAEPLAETAAEIEQLDAAAPRVAIIVAEKQDLLTLERAEHELEQRDIRSEIRVMSTDEEPEAVADYTENARARGIRVIIAGAGPGARLAAKVTGHTRLPVIGVPLTSQGAAPENLHRLLSDRPEGREEPVAWVGLDDATGGAVLAARILGA